MKDMNSSKKGSYQCIRSNRKATENVCPLLNGVRDLVTKNAVKEISVFFTSLFNGGICLQESQAPETRQNVSRKDLLLLEKVQVREHLNKLDIHIPM